MNILLINWTKNQKCIKKGFSLVLGQKLGHMYDIKDLCDTSKAFYYK